MIKVSVLVPVYNVENYIQRCAESLFEQTYPNIEFIFVDDASPDDSIKILKSTIKAYPKREKNIKIITHDKNRGLAAVRNTGVSNATGDLLFFVDSDDYIEKQTIEWMVKKQEETDADMIIGNFYLHSKDGIQKINYPRYEKKKDLILCMLGTDIFHSVWNKLMRRSLFVNHAIRADEGCNFGEDQIQMIQATYFARSFSYIDYYTYHYNCQNQSSAWGKANKRFTKDIASQLMRTSKIVNSFFKDKEPDYYKKAVATEFHFFFLCLSRLCDSNQKEAYYHIYRQFYPADTKWWPLGKIQKTLYKSAFSNYYLMSLFLRLKRFKNHE